MSPRTVSYALTILLVFVSSCSPGDDPGSPAAGREPLHVDALGHRVHLLNLPGGQVRTQAMEVRDLHDKSQGRVVAAVERQQDFRRALLLRDTEWVEFGGLGSGPARLTFGVTFAGGEWSEAGSTVLAIQSVDAGGVLSDEPLWSREFKPAAPPEERLWSDIVLELPAGVSGGLRFSASEGAKGQTPLLALGSPVLEYLESDISAVAKPPSCVVLVLIDTLRADHLEPYGRGQGTSPIIQALATESLVFADASAASSWTKASVASLLTGRYPSLNRVEDYADQLPSSEQTVADAMGVAGYKTAAFGFNTWIFNPKFGFAKRFDEFFEVLDRTTPRETRSDAIVDEAADWIARNGDEPFFLYVHTIDPHAPYLPTQDAKAHFVDAGYSGPADEWVALARTVGREPFKDGDLGSDDLDHVRALYDAEIAFNDGQVGVLIERLRTLGLWEECLFILVSDHGEEFLEHGAWSHGGTLFQEQLHVPLIVKPPLSSGLKPGRIETPVSLIDVVPTILHIQRVRDHDMQLSGQSLAELSYQPDLWKRSFVLAELDRDNTDMVAVREGRWKLITKFAPQSNEQFFDLSEDPGEHSNRIDEGPEEVLERLRQLTKAHRSMERSEGLYIVAKGAGAALNLQYIIESDGPLPSVRMAQKGEGDSIQVIRGQDGPDRLVVRANLEEGEGEETLLFESSDPSAAIKIKMFVDGEPVSSTRILIGPESRTASEDGFLLVRMDDETLVADPGSFDDSPTAPYVRVFVVPPSDLTLSEEEVSGLRGLGYFGGDGND